MKLVDEAFQSARGLVERAVRVQRPDLQGRAYEDEVIGGSPVEISRLCMLVSAVLERLGIDYFVPTGSLASCAYGEVRFTRDVDFVVAIFPRHAAELVTCSSSPTSTPMLKR